ncbi:HipA family kinase [Gemmobacter sp. LW-1]|uniref:HipA family kinase n=1 Tax=Gemmobacter sp. LW-1 TaxID=1529005 RepID=UPI0006C75FC5|nr:HipA family kinase [Gemmobacter sp. LW-1]
MFLLPDQSRRHGVLKDLNIQQLVNELLAAALGRELGLPVPTPYLGFAPLGTLSAKMCPLANGTGHLLFVSEDVGTPNLAQQVNAGGGLVEAILVNVLKDWISLGNLYAFDAWIANTDRHQGNLLIDGPANIWLIDHGHAFTGPLWQPQDLDPIRAYRHRLSEWLTGKLSPTQKSEKGRDAALFATKIAAVPVDQAVVDGAVDKLLSPSAAQALKDFLMKRVQHVPKHARDALGVPVLIP